MKTGRILFEMLLFFLVFFLPGYLSQAAISTGRTSGSLAMLQSILIGAPQFLLMVYVVSIPRDPPLDAWGIVPFAGRDALRIVLLLFGCFAIFAPFAALMLVVPHDWSKYLASGFRWRLSSATQIPLALAFGLVAGYREEFFFRSYLLKRFDQLGFSMPFSVAVSTVVFCIGHGYEGPLGLTTAAALGVLFAAVYLRRRSLHVIAIGHGLYNATVLCLSLVHAAPLSTPAEIGTFFWAVAARAAAFAAVTAHAVTSIR